MAALPYATGAVDPSDPAGYGLGQFSIPPELVAQRKAIEARMNAPRAPMYTPEQAAQRRADNDREYNLGLLAQLSGDDVLSPVGGGILKNAIEGAKTKTTDRGTVDPLSGKFTYDPDYLAQRDETALATWDANVGKMRTDWDKRQEDNRTRREIAAERDETRRMIAATRPHTGGGPNFEFAGYTPDGQPVAMDRKTAMSYVIGQGPGGQPSYTPMTGPTVPKNTWDKQVQDSQEALGAASRSRDILAKAAANPKAFSVLNSATAALPGALQGYAASALGVPDDVRQLRANVQRDAAMELHNIYGAAQSAGELRTAAGWAPNATDDLPTTLAKLRSAVDWAETKARAGGRGVVKAAAARSGVPVPAAPGAPASAPAPKAPANGARVVVDY